MHEITRTLYVLVKSRILKLAIKQRSWKTSIPLVLNPTILPKESAPVFSKIQYLFSKSNLFKIRGKLHEEGLDNSITKPIPEDLLIEIVVSMAWSIYFRMSAEVLAAVIWLIGSLEVS